MDHQFYPNPTPQEIRKCKVDPLDPGSIVDLCWQYQSSRECASSLDQLRDVLQEQNGNWFLVRPSLQAQDICQRLVGADWARHGADDFATVTVPKGNPRHQDPLSMLSTKNILCGSAAVLVQ